MQLFMLLEVFLVRYRNKKYFYIDQNKNLLLGPSSSDFPPFDESKWTLFEADTASASGKTVYFSFSY